MRIHDFLSPLAGELEPLSDEKVIRCYVVLSCCNFGDDVPEQSRWDFLHSLIPHEAFLAAK